MTSEASQSTQQLPYTCGDAQCQQQLVALQTQLSYYRLEIDTLREALKTLLHARKDAQDTSMSKEQCSGLAVQPPAGRAPGSEDP